MPAITMDVAEFATKAKEVIASLKRDEEVILTGDNQQVVAKLIQVNGQANVAKPKRRQLGQSDSILWISPDFDAPLEEFQEYMP